MKVFILFDEQFSWEGGGEALLGVFSTLDIAIDRAKKFCESEELPFTCFNKLGEKYTMLISQDDKATGQDLKIVEVDAELNLEDK